MVALYRSALVMCAALCGGVLASCHHLAPGVDVSVRTFSDPPAAGEALAAALRSDDGAALQEILGRDAVSLLASGDAVDDESERARFVRLYDQAHQWTSSGAGSAVLEIGPGAWPFPVPLVRSAGGWAFDLAQGADELLNRRIGRNELGAIQACLAFVDAQNEYYQRNPRGAAKPEYARYILSRPGQKDGLYWQTAPGESPSPLGPAYAQAREAGYAPRVGAGKPFHGYLFRVLHGQGASAPGGAYDYVVDGAMTEGFALVAWPARYGSSGVMTFLISQVGVLYEKDLGSDTAALVEGLKSFDPDESWTIVSPEAQVLPGG